MQRYLVQPNDVLVTVMGTIGRVAVVPEEIEPGIINPRLVKYVVRQKYILPYFFVWVFRSKAGEAQLSEMAQGVTMDGLNLTVLSDLWMPVPSLDEQNNIVTYIDKITGENNQLQNVVKRQIEKLQEYRRSLITAAVTGKLAIREVEPDV
jgi:type I restriction enzyme, S subunit